MDPSETRIAHFIFNGLIDTVTNFVNHVSGTMMTIIGPAAASLLTIYVLLWGLGIAIGQIQEPFTDGLKRIARMSIIVSLALTASIYQSNVSSFFLTVPTAVSANLQQGDGVTDGGGNANCTTTPNEQVPVATTLDVSLCQGFTIGQKVWQYAGQQSGISNLGLKIGYYALAILIYIAVVVIVGVAAGILFVAFIAMAVLLAVGPMFILLAIFPATQRFFESWFGQLVNFALLFIIMGCAIALVFAVLDNFYQQLINEQVTDGSVIVDFVKVVGMTLAVVVVLLQTRSIASALGGGVHLHAQNLAGKLAGAGQSAAGAGRAVMTGSSQKGFAEDRAARGLGQTASQRMALGNSVPAAGRRIRQMWQGSNTASKA